MEINPDEYENVNGEIIPMRTWLIPLTTKELSTVTALCTAYIAEKVTGQAFKIPEAQMDTMLMTLKNFTDKISNSFEEANPEFIGMEQLGMQFDTGENRPELTTKVVNQTPPMEGCERGKCMKCNAEVWITPSMVKKKVLNSTKFICLTCAVGEI